MLFKCIFSKHFILISVRSYNLSNSFRFSHFVLNSNIFILISEMLVCRNYLHILREGGFKHYCGIPAVLIVLYII